MTSSVTIDAHAGWPIKVTSVQNGSRTSKIVPAGTVDTMYVHSSCDLIVHEVQTGEAVGLAGRMDFGSAIAWLKAGFKVAREGWNGKGMWLVLVPGTASAQLKDGTPYQKALGAESCEILPHIDMWTINSEGRRAMLPGWVASQTDMLSEDWVVVEVE